MTLKILSWNIWIEGYFDKITKFIKVSNADIIGLQEVRNDDPKRKTIGFFEKLGYQHVFVPIRKTLGKKVWNDGPAIFSKYDIKGSKTYSLSKTDNRVLLKADIRLKDKTLHVFNTHLLHTH